MVRDLTGKCVKKHLSGFEQFYMEKFYIHHNKAYQIVRVKKYNKLSGDIVDVVYTPITACDKKKVKSYTITLEAFENRKYYTFLGKVRFNIKHNI